MIGSSIPNKSQIEVLIMSSPDQRSYVTQESAAQPLPSILPIRKITALQNLPC
jgi:hypothetical protein